MPARLALRTLAAFAVLGGISTAHGQSGPEVQDVAATDIEVLLGGDAEDIEHVTLEDLLNRTVTTATRSGETVRESPAVITVVTRDEILRRGLLSLADILRTVPGFYDVYDLVTHNVGVRGINGGVRASGSVIKVMIDGHPVHFRPSTGNFFGPELIPIDAVDRVEILRGPASALYGSNAFLGVVNVITRSGSDGSGLTLSGTAGRIRDRPGYGGSIVLTGAEGGLNVLVAAGLLDLDRSGLDVPGTSPILRRSDNPLVGGRTRSLRDEAHPRSFYGRADLSLADAGRVRFWSSVQHLDAKGEFVDFEPLTHRTRIALNNQSHGLEYGIQPVPELQLDVQASYFLSEPSDDERLSIGRTDFDLLRDVEVSGVEGRFELRADLDPVALTVGMDWLLEEHRTQTYDRLLLTDVRSSDGAVVRSAGTIIPGPGGADRQFTNLGLYVQAIWQVHEAWSLTGGLRLDRHSIYDVHLSPRAAAVFAPPDEPYYAKLLFGSSFKAPSAEQLFTESMREFDIRGNQQLDPQTAHTLELAGGYRIGGDAEILSNVYVMMVDGLVEFTQRGLFLRAENARDDVIAGAELESRVSVHRDMDLQLGVGYSQTVSSAAREERVVLGVVEPDQALFPALQAHLIGTWRLPVLRAWELSVSPELSYVSARPASQSNVLEEGRAYALPAYFYTALAIHARVPLGSSGGLRLRLRATDLLDDRPAEPGFGGVDVPGLGRTMFLTASLTHHLF